MFDWQEELDELRIHSLEWLREARSEAVREERRWHLRRLAITRVLDERGALTDAVAAEDGVRIRDVHEAVEVARALDDLPCVAAAGGDGLLSAEQLTAATRLADATTDAEWAARAPRCTPVDLQRMVRAQRTPTADESRRRFEARELRTWWDETTGMLRGRFALPDLQGAAFESVIDQLVERQRPRRGEPWERRERRAADALTALVERFQGATDTIAEGIRPKVVVHVPPSGPGEVGGGVMLADETLEQLRVNCVIEAVVVDDHGSPIGMARAIRALSPRRTRAVLTRDGACRFPGCGTRTGLEVHHLVPRSAGGTDEISNLAAVCAPHHRRLVPHGRLRLVGNPNRPDGLELVEADGPGHSPRRRSRPDPTRHRWKARAGPAPPSG
ncbi:MAG: HNH endonuclease [Actinomycetes bacterium]|jgi:hypothetical protein